MPKDHALLSASRSHRWLACTPSAVFEQQFPASSSSYAEEGTLAHAVAEVMTRRALNEITDDELDKLMQAYESNSYFNEEMRACAVSYAAFVSSRLAEAKRTCADPIVVLESKLDFSRYVPKGFGTGDCLIIAEPVLEVIDFKYGKGVRVESENNPQMQLYALGALEEYDRLYDIDRVRMTIFQPRLSGTYNTAEKTVKELKAWGMKTVKPRAKLAIEGKGDFAPSEETCRFCRAKAQCRARTEANLKLFDESPDALTITLEEAGAILEKAGDIEGWLKDLKELVTSALTGGETVPGWKMVEGRSDRKLADADKVVDALRKAGIADAILFERKLNSLTQLEKDVGKKRLAEILGDLIVKPRGMPTLAPESDKRPAYRFEEATLAAFDE